jgi:hypothetical protein
MLAMGMMATKGRLCCSGFCSRVLFFVASVRLRRVRDGPSDGRRFPSDCFHSDCSGFVKQGQRNAVYSIGRNRL